LFGKGVFLLDIEIELAWGMMTAPSFKLMDKEKAELAARRIRDHLGEVLSLLEKYRVPVTWDIVGHVILDRCERHSELKLPHADMPRPSYRWMEKDWYWFDPCRTLVEDPAYYGRDITDSVIRFVSKAAVEHDVGCHSFSHVVFGDENCSERVAQAEVEKCVALLRDNYEIRPSVFIFPRNSVGHLDVLRKSGFNVFRGIIPYAVGYSESKAGLANSLRKYTSLALQFASFHLRTTPPLVMPIEEQGLINIPASFCYSKPPFIPLSAVVGRAKKGIRKAAETKKIFHLFTHDINFGLVDDAHTFIEGFEEILKCAHGLWKRNELEITTMRRIAEDFTG